MWDFLNPQKFDTCVKAAVFTAGEKVADKELENPSVAIKIGHNLSKLASIKRAIGLRNNDEITITEANRFLELKESEWVERVTALARDNLAVRKHNKIVTLPKTEDIKKLTVHLKEKLGKSLTAEECTFETYREIQTLVLTRLLTFNRRRPGELEQMLVTSYINRPNWLEEGIDKIKKNMTPLEKKLITGLDMIELRGKRGRKVPVLLPVECKAPMAFLQLNRDKFGIPEANIYFFATKGDGCLSAGNALSKVASSADLEAPEFIKATLMRKYVATISQVLDLGENQLEWLANHLGHDISVHRQYYRLQESTLEMTKVAKLLMMVDAGKVDTGKSLDDISLEDLDIALSDGESDEDEKQLEIPEKEQQKGKRKPTAAKEQQSAKRKPTATAEIPAKEQQKAKRKPTAAKEQQSARRKPTATAEIPAKEQQKAKRKATAAKEQQRAKRKRTATAEIPAKEQQKAKRKK